MQKFQCLLFVMKRSYICHYIICMTVPLICYFCNNQIKLVFYGHVTFLIHLSLLVLRYIFIRWNELISLKSVKQNFR